MSERGFSMNIKQVISDRFSSIKGSPPSRSLQPGQIIQGHILGLYPGNKANIQIGNETLIAQLETSLNLGETYHLQVQTSDDVILLKVIGEKSSKQTIQTSSDLLRQLGFKPRTYHASLVHRLMTHHIPVSTRQLEQAFQLLDTETNKDKAQLVLKNMIATKLPITDTTFQALMSQEEDAFSNQLHGLKKALGNDHQQTRLTHQLISKIDQLLSQPPAVSRSSDIALNEGLKTNQTMANILKLTGMFHEGKNQEDESRIRYGFQMLSENQQKIIGHAKQFEALFSHQVKRSLTSNKPLSEDVYQHIKQFMSQQMRPLLSENQTFVLDKDLVNEPSQLGRLMQHMQLLKDKDMYIHVERMLMNPQLLKGLASNSLQHQFIHHLTNVLNTAGFTYENQVMNETNQHLEHHLKALLLQFVEQSEGAASNQAKQLIHIINGLQLQSVNDMNHLIYAHIQIPAEKLGLVNDLALHFEGIKKNGQISTDFCRIHFFLELTHLKQTIIDMNVQKRAVSLTVYNNTPGLKTISSPFKTALKSGLKTLNYQLSSLEFKSFDEEASHFKTGAKENETQYKSRVDYRV